MLGQKISLEQSERLASLTGMNTFSKQYEKAKTEPDNPYDLSAVGCYVDSARGIYSIDAILRFAEDHGYRLQDVEEKFFGDNDYSMSSYEFQDEIEDEIDNHMNSKYSVDGASWSRNESGDWGLWTIENN